LTFVDSIWLIKDPIVGFVKEYIDECFNLVLNMSIMKHVGQHWIRGGEDK